jgi:outer membrane biosynthesis protein TonB
LSAELLGWHDEHLLDHRRRLRTAMFVSLAAHGLIFAVFAASPPVPVFDVPQSLAVELVAALPAAARAARPAPSPPAPAPPAAEPEPPPPPAPPVRKAPVQVLPEETPGRIREAKPEPEKVAKVKPKPAPTPKPPARKRRPKEKALSFEDAMAALEDELGVDETAELLVPQAQSEAAVESDASAVTTAARPGVTVTPEQAAWDREVSRLIRENFPTFARFSGRGLVARLEVVVSATGKLAGEPRLIGTSGDPDFDGMAIAVVERAAPLPPPPSPGVRRLNMTSE